MTLSWLASHGSRRADRGRRAGLGWCLAALLLAACHGVPPGEPTPDGQAAAVAAATAEPAWQTLFDGRSLDGWQATEFGGEGTVAVREGAVALDFGSPMTGITWIGVPSLQSMPPEGYELAVEAARVAGQDFFAAITFPVGDAALTLVLGGWGGTVCGLSQIDGQDAAYNPTRRLRSFERLRRYEARIQVLPDRVAVTLDGEPLCEVMRPGSRLSLRSEMLPCQPLGIAAYNTQALIHQVRWRPLAR